MEKQEPLSLFSKEAKEMLYVVSLEVLFYLSLPMKYPSASVSYCSDDLTSAEVLLCLGF